jgi:hypothetical protein
MFSTDLACLGFGQRIRNVARWCLLGQKCGLDRILIQPRNNNIKFDPGLTQ